MIYGINFNGTPIPPAIKAKFTARKRILCPTCKNAAEQCPTCQWGKRAKGYINVDLKGVAQSPEERDAMLIQANNGYRHLHVVTRQTAGGEWYGIYIY